MFKSEEKSLSSNRKKSSSRVIRGIEDYVAEGAVITDSVDLVLESGKYLYQNEFSF